MCLDVQQSLLSILIFHLQYLPPNINEEYPDPMHTVQLVLVEILLRLQLQQPLAELLTIFYQFDNQDDVVEKPKDDIG